MNLRHRLLRFAIPSFLLGLGAMTSVAYGQTVLRPKKVVYVMLENSTYSDIIGKTDPHTGCPFINSLLPIAANMTQATGNTHPTDPNYMYFFAGNNLGLTTNGDPRTGGAQLTAPNLGRNLINAGFTFVNYAENMKAPGDLTYYFNAPEGQYFLEENVPGYWVGTGTNQIPATCMQPLENLPANYANLPTVSFWHPVEDHDMHQGFYDEKHAAGDVWLRQTLANYVQWAMKNNSLLIITWDESYTSNEDPALYNHIPMLLVGPMVNPGNYADSIEHVRLLRTVEDMYGLAYAGASATKTPLTSIWRTSVAPVVSLDGPVNFTDLQAPANITLSASVVANAHSITKVQFYNGSTLLGESTTAPYTYAWNGVPASGFEMSISAKAVYDSGSVVSSAPVSIGVWPASQPLSTGLVAYLDFEGNLNAAGGTSTNGTVFPVGRTPHYVTGKLGQAVDFINNGSSSSPSDWAVSLGNLDATYAGDFSYSFWVRTTSTADSAVFGNKDWTSGGNTGFVVTTDPSGKTFNWFGTGGNRHDLGVFPPVYNGAWHLVTQTYSRTNNRVVTYLDGAFASESTLSTNSGTASLSAGLNTLIGASGSGGYAATCTVDDAAVWSRVLNPLEVATIYTNGQSNKTLLGATPPAPPPVTPVTDNLQVYLKGDGNLSPSGGTAVTGTVFSGTAHYATGKFGQAFSFTNNGSSSTAPSDWAASLGNLESLYAGDFTLSFWEQSSSTVDAALLGNKNWSSGSNVGWVVATTTNKNVNWNAASGTRRDVPISGFSDGTWHHVAVVFKRSTNQVITYRDGTGISTSDISPSGTASFNASYATLLGSSGPGTWAGTGNLDDVAIWTRALSATDVGDIYTRGQTGQPLIP